MGNFHGYEVVQIDLDGVTVEVARAVPDTRSEWVARTATAMATASAGNEKEKEKGSGSVPVWEYDAGWLLYHPEINRIMAQHFAHRSPVEPYKSKQERASCVDVTVNLAANRGFRTNGYCLMSESFTLTSPAATAGSSRNVTNLRSSLVQPQAQIQAHGGHRRVSPFFKTRAEAERVLALLEAQEHFGAATAVVPTRPYCLLLPTRIRTRPVGTGSELTKNLSYYIMTGDANSCLYDTAGSGGSSSDRDEYNRWDVR
jgi:hypothetical protein